MEHKAGKRELSLDLIRALAGISVVGVHFFLNCGYQEQTVEGLGMLAMTVVRMGFMVSVPLFLLLSGYLCCNKKWSGRYYLGIVRVLITYLLATLGCFLYRWTVLKEAVSLKAVLKGLLAFTGAPYAWYIEMYIGLFLLIPFINLAWQGAETKACRGAMVAALLGLTTLPALCNTWGTVLPDWWVELYPLTYYVLGAWLRTYPPRVKWTWGIPAAVASVLAGGCMAYALWYQKTCVYTPAVYWYGPTVVVSACLLFLLLRQVKPDKAPGWLKWLICKGSELSLGIYLISWCFDTVFYPLLAAREPLVTHRLLWMPAVVLAVYLCSALASQVMLWLQKGIILGLNKLFPRLELK